MKDMIRKYFEQMLENEIDIESAKDNLMDLVVEIASEFEEDEN